MTRALIRKIKGARQCTSSSASALAHPPHGPPQYPKQRTAGQGKFTHTHQERSFSPLYSSTWRPDSSSSFSVLSMEKGWSSGKAIKSLQTPQGRFPSAVGSASLVYRVGSDVPRLVSQPSRPRNQIRPSSPPPHCLPVHSPTELFFHPDLPRPPPQRPASPAPARGWPVGHGHR